jgi:hypothetical protein
MFFSFLLSKIPARFPSFLILFSLLLGYTLLVSFLMKRIKNNLKQASKTLLLLGLAVLLFSAVGFGLSFLAQAKNRLSWNGILHMKITGRQALAQWKYYLGIFTQKDGEFRLPLGLDDLQVTGFPTENSDTEKFHSYALHESGEARSLLFPLYRWSHRFFTLSGLGEFPIQAKAQLYEQELSLSIENRSSFPILNCAIYYDGRLFAFGNIAPEEKIIKKVNLKALSPKNAFTSEGVEVILKTGLGVGPGSFLKEIEKELTKDVWISIHERNQLKSDRIVLIGWIDSLVFPAPMKYKAPFRDSVSLLEWEIPLET